MLDRTKYSLESIASKLADGSVTSRELVDTCIANIENASGEGSRTFRVVNPAQAITAADQCDAERRSGGTMNRFAGIPISIKDLFDVAGEQTRAGSRVLCDQAPAANDAPVIARLRSAGFIFIGRTNMTEFAYSGLGLNPHYGTPLNPWDRASNRIPGGSSSGAAVSITDGMALAGLGTDTGGSCRIPAAMCGIVGFKPTQRRVPLRGVSPLSFSLDSVGPLANTVDCCAALDTILANDDELIDPPNPSNLKIAVLRNYVFDGVEDEVANSFDSAITQLSDAGVSISDLSIDALDELPKINAKGGFAAAEAFAWHQPLLAKNADAYDPRVGVRISVGAKQTAADYIHLSQHPVSSDRRSRSSKPKLRCRCISYRTNNRADD